MRHADLEMALEKIDLVGGDQDLDHVCMSIAQSCCDTVGAERASIWVKETIGQEVILRYRAPISVTPRRGSRPRYCRDSRRYCPPGEAGATETELKYGRQQWLAAKF